MKKLRAKETILDQSEEVVLFTYNDKDGYVTSNVGFGYFPSIHSDRNVPKSVEGLETAFHLA